MYFKSTTQVKAALRKAGVNMDKVTVTRSYDTIEIECETKKATAQVRKLTGWGGYTTGYGAAIFQQGYQSLGDPMDKSSRHHY